MFPGKPIDTQKGGDKKDLAPPSACTWATTQETFPGDLEGLAFSGPTGDLVLGMSSFPNPRLRRVRQ